MLNGPAMNDVLERWNRMDEISAEAEVMACNGSTAWARGLALGRPYADEAAVYEASDRVWLGLTQEDWLEAFATHPRIGESHAAASAKALAWSGTEQREAMAGAAYEAQLLAEGNREYEAKFGRTFLICASGRSKAEILEVLKARMSSTADEERNEAAEQQRQITRVEAGQMDEERVMGISTHILDTAMGRPASNVEVALSRFEGADWVALRTETTDADGRCKAMLADGEALRVGAYRLRFATATYYEAQGLRGLYPWVEIAFEVRDAEQHFHIPLLLTANGYTTYRGS